ncbi:Tmem43, partial [Symbiodinium sp. KB8]
MGNAFGFGDQNLGNVSVEHESFCQRLGGALCGVCLGLVFFVGSIFLLGWNEFNYVRNQAVLLKVGKETVIAGCTPQPSTSGSPIWASCEVQQTYDFGMDSRVKDIGLTFTGDLEGAVFQASSEIYQWKEDKQCSSHSTTGGGKEKVCTYDYSLGWASSPIDSSTFYCYPTMRSGCLTGGSKIRNSGTIPQQLKTTLSAPDNSVGMGSSKDGMYLMNRGQLDVFPKQPAQLPSQAQVSPLLPNKQAVVVGPGKVQFESVSGQDSVGDVRTTFTYSAIQKGVTKVSVIAKQGTMSPTSAHIASLSPWNTGLSGTMSTVNWALVGYHTKQDMIDEKSSENGAMVMILRLVGFVVMLLGLQLVTGPIALMPQVLPCVGELIGEVVGAALCCLNFMISLALSFTVIGAAWLMARPIFGIVLLLAAAAVVFLAHSLRKKYRNNPRSPRIDEPFMTGAAPQVQVAQQVQVTCPPNVQPGQFLLVQGPHGRQCQVQVPAGVQPGQ